MDSRMRAFAFATIVASVDGQLGEFCSETRAVLTLTDADKYVMAVNYFRCQHGQSAISWDTSLVTKAETIRKGCPGMTYTTGTQKKYTAADVANSVFIGSVVPEEAVETWYLQKSAVDPATMNDAGYLDGGYVKDTVREFTAMMWGDAAKIGCTKSSECVGTPAGGMQVCEYGSAKGYTTPNQVGKFVLNLPGSVTTLKKDPKVCCAEVYGAYGAKPKYPNPANPYPITTPKPRYTTPPYTTPPPYTTTPYNSDCSQWPFQCPKEAPVNKGKNIKCPTSDPNSCTVKYCCEPYATCDTFTCPKGLENLPKEFCKGGMALTIKDCDAATCCKKRATCETFKGCVGKDSAGNDISRNADAKDILCKPTGCDIDTCCTAGPPEDTCFPGEAEVSLQDRSSVRVDEIEPGMTVLAESGFEPVFGMLHLHSEVSPTFAHATTASV